jgi:hypothetical protein
MTAIMANYFENYIEENIALLKEIQKELEE